MIRMEDWDNNYYGYSYTDDQDAAFKQAKPFLILADKVKSSDYRKVYDGNWYK